MSEAGLVDGKLRPCPSSPNCVCSQESDPSHRVEPWPFSDEPEAARERLLAALKSLPRMELLSSEPRYLHATFTSAIFRWVDDVELLIDEEARLVHVRSASRSGWSDLGVNRRRARDLRATFESASLP